jgi:hypothetical protein
VVRVQALNDLLNGIKQVLVIIWEFKCSESSVDPAGSRYQKWALTIQVSECKLMNDALGHLHHLLTLPHALIFEVTKGKKQCLGSVVVASHRFQVAHDSIHVILQMNWSLSILLLSKSERAHLLYHD